MSFSHLRVHPKNIDAIIDDFSKRLHSLSAASPAEKEKKIQSISYFYFTTLKNLSFVDPGLSQRLMNHIHKEVPASDAELLTKLEGITASFLPVEMNGERANRLLLYFNQSVNSCSTWPEVEQMHKLLVQIDRYMQTQEETAPSLKVLFLKTCDQFSAALLNKSAARTDHPLNHEANWSQRLALAAQVRGLAAACPAKDTLFEEVSRSTPAQVPPLMLAGKKMDPGTRFHRVDSQCVSDNHVSITQRLIQPTDPTQAPQKRTEMRLQLSLQTRREMENSLEVLKEKEFVEALSKSLKCEVTVTPKVTVHYEKSTTVDPNQAVGIFAEGSAEFAHMMKIELKGIGEILIGAELGEVPASRTIDPGDRRDAIGRFIAHHTVLVRVYDGANPLKQLEEMHKALAAVGLAQVLNKGSMDQIRRNQVLQVVDTYAPHLSFPIRLTPHFHQLEWKELQQQILELIPDESYKLSDKGKEQFSRKELQEILDWELSDVQIEKTPLGKEVIKLNQVSENMRQEGAVGCFVGVTANPSIVASVLKTGLVSSHERNYAGFPFASTCQEDALSGGNESIFVRLATHKGLQDMADPAKTAVELHHCPYISTFQLIVSLDVLNLPNNRMHRNSFGLINPLAEIDVGTSHVSGTKVLRSDSPRGFVQRQNESFQVDNEIMIRTGSLDAKYIQKIVYQDPREELRHYLAGQGAPQELLNKVDACLVKGGSIPDAIKDEIDLFLKAQNLYEQVDIRGRMVDVLKGFAPKFNFGRQLIDLLQDPKENLIKELQNNGLIDNNNHIFDKTIDEFIVKSNTLTEDLFK